MKNDKMTRAELAGLLAVTGSRVSQMSAEGIFSPNADGSYPRVASLTAAVEYLRDRVNLADLKEAKLQKQNQLLDFEIERASGQLLDVAAVEKAWINIVLLTKQRLLRIPNKVSPRLPFCKSESDMEAVLQAEVDEALLELSRPADYGQGESAK
jgi:hypothetical protein